MVFPYVSGGAGYTYDLHTFFDYTPIDGCTLTCTYGATCGSSDIGEPNGNIPNPAMTPLTAPHTETSPM